MYSEDGERRDKNPSIIHHDQREESQKRGDDGFGVFRVALFCGSLKNGR
jgi:hypothetical protein